MTTIYNPNAPKMDPAQRAQLQAEREASGLKRVTAPPTRTPMRRGTYPANQEQDLSGVTTNAAGQQVIRGRGGNEQVLGAAAQRRLATAQPASDAAVAAQPEGLAQPMQVPPGWKGPTAEQLASVLAGGDKGGASTGAMNPGTAGAVAALSKNPTFQAQLASLGDAQLAAGEGGGGAPATGEITGGKLSPIVSTMEPGGNGAGRYGREATALEGAQADPTKMVTAPPGGGITDFMQRKPAGDPEGGLMTPNPNDPRTSDYVNKLREQNAGLFNPAQSGIRDRLRQILARRRGGTAAPTDEVMKQIPPPSQIPRTPGPGGVARGIAAY